MKLMNIFLKIMIKLFGGHGLTKNKFFKKIYQKTLPKYVFYKSQKFFLNCDESIYMAQHNFDSDKFNMSTFESEIKIGDIVLDIGANIGMYTLSAAKIVGNFGKVYSFEPDPIVFSNLKKNVIANNHKNVILINKAVSDKNGFQKWASSSKNDAPKFSSHLINDNINSNFLTVETVYLDDFLKNNSINVVKIDVEGSEFDVIRGMTNIIKKNDQIKILIEFNPFPLIRNNVNLIDFIDFLHSLDLTIFYIDEKKTQKTHIDKNWLLEFANNSAKNEYVNLLCMKTEFFD